jgi:aarF domain-containing kinase
MSIVTVVQRNRRLLQYATGGTISASLLYYYWPEVDFFGRASMRVTRTAWTVGMIALDYQRALGSWWKMQELRDLTSEEEAEYGKIRSRTHHRAAKQLLRLFQTNGGVYIKLGQHLSAMDFILPGEYCAILSRLHSQAPTSSPDEVALTFLEEHLATHPMSHLLASGQRSLWRRSQRVEWGRRLIADKFASFDWTPIGSASLAQVHVATLRPSKAVEGEAVESRPAEPDERRVAVKVQHYRTMGFATLDISTAAVAVKWIRRVFPQFEFGWLADELKANLPRELNFVQEGHNSERLARSLDPVQPALIVPRVHWDLSSRRILVMDYVGGPDVCKVNELDKLRGFGVDLRKLSERLTKAYSEMIFLHGFVHCDPHPGNILVRRRPKRHRWLVDALPLGSGYSDFDIVLLDHGLYRELSDDFRVNYARLWKAVVDYDEPEMARISAAMGAPAAHRLFSSCLTHRSWERMGSVNGLGSAYSLKELEAIRAKAPQFVEKISQLLNALPRDILLLLKTNDLLRSIERNLQTESPWPTSRSFLIMARYCIQAIYLHDQQTHGHLSYAWYVGNIVRCRLYGLALRYINYWHQVVNYLFPPPPLIDIVEPLFDL